MNSIHESAATALATKDFRKVAELLLPAGVSPGQTRAFVELCRVALQSSIRAIDVEPSRLTPEVVAEAAGIAMRSLLPVAEATRVAEG